jgi:hypothetical protein
VGGTDFVARFTCGTRRLAAALIAQVRPTLSSNTRWLQSRRSWAGPVQTHRRPAVDYSAPKILAAAFPLILP